MTDGPKYCGSTIRKQFSFTTNRVTLEFMADYVICLGGFMIDYSFELYPDIGEWSLYVNKTTSSADMAIDLIIT